MKNGVYPDPVPLSGARLDSARSDEELILELAVGRQESLGPLYTRYATATFRLAAHSLDRVAAEEIVQDVFLAIWRRGT